AADDSFDVEADVVVLAGFAVVGECAQADGEIVGAAGVVHGVVAGSALEGVAGGRVVAGVVEAVVDEDIVARAAVDAVAAVAGGDGVVPFPAEQGEDGERTSAPA